MKKAYIEKESGKLLGWFDTDVHISIPTPNIDVTDEDWQKAVEIGANYYEGKKFILKDIRSNELIEAERIYLIKQKAKEIIELTYPEFKQRNVLMTQDAESISAMNNFITNIRDISNKAELDGKKVSEINWE